MCLFRWLAPCNAANVLVVGCTNWKHDRPINCFQKSKKEVVKKLQKRKKGVEDEEIASDSDIERSVVCNCVWM